VLVGFRLRAVGHGMHRWWVGRRRILPRHSAAPRLILPIYLQKTGALSWSNSCQGLLWSQPLSHWCPAVLIQHTSYPASPSTSTFTTSNTHIHYHSPHLTSPLPTFLRNSRTRRSIDHVGLTKLSPLSVPVPSNVVT
jgi:hypothetical protein